MAFPKAINKVGRNLEICFSDQFSFFKILVTELIAANPLSSGVSFSDILAGIILTDPGVKVLLQNQSGLPESAMARL